jgi:hypothetical protein
VVEVEAEPAFACSTTWQRRQAVDLGEARIELVAGVPGHHHHLGVNCLDRIVATTRKRSKVAQRIRAAMAIANNACQRQMPTNQGTYVPLAIGKQLDSPRVAGKRGPARHPPMAAGEERLAFGRDLALERRSNFLRRPHSKLSYPLLSISSVWSKNE